MHLNTAASYLKIMYFYSTEHFLRHFEYFQLNYVRQFLKTISSAPFNIKMKFSRKHIKKFFTCWDISSDFAKHWRKNYKKIFDIFRILSFMPSFLRGLIGFQNSNSGLSAALSTNCRGFTLTFCISSVMGIEDNPMKIT